MIFFYRPSNFHFNILSGFEIIAKTLSVALEVSLSILNIFNSSTPNTKKENSKFKKTFESANMTFISYDFIF